MATIKSFTDLEQSKKLAEILSIKSADMRYHTISHYNSYPCDEIVYIVDFGKPSDIDVPCWSLAALLDVLPEGTILLKATNISSVGDIKYHCDCPKLNIDKWFDNPVDACVEMIIHLHELNLL